MSDFFKNIIEETFKSKKQQRLFFAKAKNSKKWDKMAHEFAKHTDFSHLPEKVKEDEDMDEVSIDEIVDDEGNIARGDMPTDEPVKEIGSKSTTDKVSSTAYHAMGGLSVAGTVKVPQRYWGESDMSKSLGYEATLGDDEDYKKAYKYFTKDLGLDDDEAKKRLKDMGYIPGEQELVRLVENPNEFMEDYIQKVITKRNIDDLVKRQNDEEKKEINPIIKKQINSLKASAESNGLDLNDIIDYLRNEQ
jgi:hypothetical protein